jgi:hypothetical protein
MNTWLRGLAFALPLSLSAFSFGCGSSTSSPSSDNDAGTQGGADSSAKGDTGGGATPTFTDVYTMVITPGGCPACHDPSTGAGSLDMSTQAKAYTDLVGVKAAGPACGTSGLTRVVKDDATTSLLYLKVSETTPPCGSPMPLNGTPLSTAETTMVKDWINGGAPNN